MRELLKKYMHNVIELEGVSFLPCDSGYRAYGFPEFTEAEIKILNEISDEIYKENYE